MNQSPMELLLENYPEGFLKQFGELLGKVVGLGEPNIEEKEFVDIMRVPVLAQGAEFGHYIITQFKNGNINSIRYEGDHPLKPQGIPRIGLTYSHPSDRISSHDDRLARTDGWKKIVFPGIPGKEQLYKYPTLELPEEFLRTYLKVHKR